MPEWSWGNWIYGNQIGWNEQYNLQVRLYEQLAKNVALISQADAVLKEEEEKEMLVNKFLVGCDPEFAMVDNEGKAVNLNTVLRAQGEVGYDHGGYVGELRPKPARGAYTLIKHLRALISGDTFRSLPGAKARAGAYFQEKGDRGRVDLGGHVHFGFKYDEEWATKLDALDHLTRRLEALDILPQKESEARRRGPYGRFGDFRLAGDLNERVEYRTMASWLHDPKVAFACLTLSKMAAYDPATCKAMLGRFHDFKPLVQWVEAFAAKDDNARRLSENLLSKGVKGLQADPEADFRERWMGELSF